MKTPVSACSAMVIYKFAYSYQVYQQHIYTRLMNVSYQSHKNRQLISSINDFTLTATFGD